MSGTNFNDTTQKATQFNTVTIVRSDADLPPIELAPDGVMRHKLKKSHNYMIDTSFLLLNNGIWIEDHIDNGVSTRIESTSITFVLYTATDTFLFQRENAQLDIRNMFFSANTPGTLFWDTQASLKANVLGFMFVHLSGFIGFDMGIISNYESVEIIRSFFTDYREGLNLHDVRNTRFSSNPVQSFVGNKNLLYITGNCSAQLVEKTSPTLTTGDSLLAVDQGSVWSGQLGLQNIAFTASVGATFFQPNISGSISAFADLSLLITGSSLNFTLHPSGFTKVTQTGHSSYHGLTINVTGTTSYNGRH